MNLNHFLIFHLIIHILLFQLIRFFDCIENGDVSSNSIFIVQDCWNSLSLEQKASLIAQGGAAAESVCREVFAGNEYVEEICSYVYMIVHVFEK